MEGASFGTIYRRLTVLGGYVASDFDKNDKTSPSKLLMGTSLQGYFYDQLQSINSKSTDPLSNETIYYSSMVMDRLGESKKYFETSEGRVSNKILGMKLMESSKLSGKKQIRMLQDIGETSLLLCGYFSESLNRKLVDTKYYSQIGIIAYARLNACVPDAYRVPAFFKQVSNTFTNITMMINLVAEKSFAQDENGQHSSIILIADRTKAS